MEQTRDLSIAESAILAALLKRDIPGVDQLREQANGLKALVVDLDGSLSLYPSMGTHPAEVIRSVPTEGWYPDLDGAPVHVLLHVQRGFLNEMEFYRDDGAVVSRKVDQAIEFIPEPI